MDGYLVKFAQICWPRNGLGINDNAVSVLHYPRIISGCSYWRGFETIENIVKYQTE
jgi:hypothetical protein